MFRRAPDYQRAPDAHRTPHIHRAPARLNAVFSIIKLNAVFSDDHKTLPQENILTNLYFVDLSVRHLLTCQLSLHF